jgi:RNA polymerase sigma-70 factor, ECF subfamily
MELVDPRVAAFVNGDRSAGEGLLLELLPRVRNVIRILVGRDRDVDDIAQMVMVNVIRSLPGYRGEAPLVSWVDRITARTTLAHVKKRRAKEYVESDFEEERPSVVNANGEHPPSAEGAADVGKVLGFLDVLPETQRQAVVLHHALGYTVAEAATQQGVSGETLRSRLRLGMGRLRDWCGGSAGEPNPKPTARSWASVPPAEVGQPAVAEQELP